MSQRCFQGDNDSGDAKELITEEERVVLIDITYMVGT